MDGMYLIPANSKKSMLIFGVFREIDLILFGTGVFITLILLFALPGDSITELLIKLAPVAISGFLVMPLPFYHNILVFIIEIYSFFMNRRVYLWKGWCASDGAKE
jgi:hypothetical protein